GALNNFGAVDGLQAWLHPGAHKEQKQALEKHQAAEKAAAEAAAKEGKPAPEAKPMKPGKFDGIKKEQAQFSYIFGGLFAVLGVVALAWRPREGNLDYGLSVFPGIAFILLIAFVVRWGLDPMFANWGKAASPTLGWDFAKIFNLNYVVLGIVIGIVIVNFLRIPAWAANGVRTARFFLKTGVILLGTLYSAAELAQLGALSVVMIGVFVLGSVWLVLLMGPRMGATNSMTGVLSAGVGVCGVSAAVAVSPVVNAKAVDIAFTLGTILLWGVLCMFIFPTIGQLLGMGPVQFGAWAGTGILNSAQVAGAALAFDPKGIETLKVAEIFNITRVLFLPIIVLWLAAWYVKREVGATQVNLGQVLIAKFPVFVLGFILMFALSSMGLFAPAGHYQGKYFSSEQVKAESLLNDKELAALQAALPKARNPQETQVLQDLIANKKETTREQDNLLRSIAKVEGLDKPAKDALAKAHKVAWHDSKIIKAFRDWIAWLFAFGLIGLGMQITGKAIKQAGGKPLIIGSVVGTIKAVGSLIVVLLFVREFV
ncbi:MAG TPA: putative sulfate exporter family transporter, partial [Burkholderiales bacterium]